MLSTNASSDLNPYAPPTEVRDSSPSVAVDSDLVSVDGEYLVVRPGAVLPSRCVLTNQELDERQRRRDVLRWARPGRFVVLRQQCGMSYCLSPEFVRSHQQWMLRQLLIVACICVPLTLWLQTYVLVLMALIAFCDLRDWRPKPLKIKTSRNGRYWIEGCGDEFLQACQQELGDFSAED